MLRRTSASLQDNYFAFSFRFPQRKGIVLRVLTNNEVTHLRHGRLFHANFAAQFFDLGRRFLYRGTPT